MIELEKYPDLRPIAGLVFEAYMSRNDVGSGRRMFVVSKVGHKFVHLFYMPHLFGFKLTHAQWRDLFLAPLAQFSQANWRAALKTKQRQYDHIGFQYSKRLVERMLRIELTCGEGLFRLHTHRVKPHVPRKVKRGVI